MTSDLTSFEVRPRSCADAFPWLAGASVVRAGDRWRALIGSTVLPPGGFEEFARQHRLGLAYGDVALASRIGSGARVARRPRFGR